MAVAQHELNGFLAVAEELRVRGLCESPARLPARQQNGVAAEAKQILIPPTGPNARKTIITGNKTVITKQLQGEARRGEEEVGEEREPPGQPEPELGELLEVTPDIRVKPEFTDKEKGDVVGCGEGGPDTTGYNNYSTEDITVDEYSGSGGGGGGVGSGTGEQSSASGGGEQFEKLYEQELTKTNVKLSGKNSTPEHAATATH